MRWSTFVLALMTCGFCLPSITMADTFGSGADQFTVNFVVIGDPLNVADMTGNPNPAGSVDYVFRMGKHEISRDMVTKANRLGNLDIALANMDFVAGGTRPGMPATGLSWNEAARFANWLNTSQAFPAAYKFSTQPGDVGYSANANILLWQSTEAGYNPANPFRNSLARYFLPSTDEWYKSAFYDPNANGGVGDYWDYPTGSDAAPVPVTGGTDPGTAVYAQDVVQGPADITNAGGVGHYGVMGLGGNADEWEETAANLVNDNASSARGIRGGNWFGIPDSVSASFRVSDGPTSSLFNIGFRVASIPEPSSLLLVGVSMLGVPLGWRRVR